MFMFFSLKTDIFQFKGGSILPWGVQGLRGGVYFLGAKGGGYFLGAKGGGYLGDPKGVPTYES